MPRLAVHQTKYFRIFLDFAAACSRLHHLDHVPMKSNHDMRLRRCFLLPLPASCGEGRGEWLLPQARTRGKAPSPGSRKRDPTSPRKLAQAGRGEAECVDLIGIRSKCEISGLVLADHFVPDTQQTLSTSVGTGVLSQQCGVGPCQPLRTKVHARHDELASQAPWQFWGMLFAGREKFWISEPGRSLP
jgi:hypothetical protein